MMETLDDLTQKHMATVKEMGILENELDITIQDLKEISLELGMTEEGWLHVMNLAQKKLVLAESHFIHKSYRECILVCEEAQLLNPFINGARGQKAKAFLLLSIHEEDDSYLDKAAHQAKLTLEKESNDKNAIEVMATLSSKNRLLNKKEVGASIKTLLILVAVGSVIAIGVLFAMFKNGKQTQNVYKEKLEIVEKQLQSAFEKQEALIPKVEALLSDSKQDAEKLNALKEIKQKLNNQNLSLKEQLTLHEILGESLSSIVYQKSALSETQLLKDLRVLLEGAENRINTERKNYNTALGNYQSDVGNASSTEIFEKL